MATIGTFKKTGTNEFTGEIVTRGSIKPGDSFYTALHGNRAPKRSKGQRPGT